MTQEEKLQYCKVCVHKKMDFQQGLLCGLTNEKPSFDMFCKDYERDVAAENKQKERDEARPRACLLPSGFRAIFSLHNFVLLRKWQTKRTTF